MTDFSAVSSSPPKSVSYRIIERHSVCKEDTAFDDEQPSTSRMPMRMATSGIPHDSETDLWHGLDGQQTEVGHSLKEDDGSLCGVNDAVMSYDATQSAQSSELNSHFAIAPDGSLPAFPFRIGLSSKGLSGTLIVITEDGKTWRRKRVKRRRDGVVTESFCCISCEKLIRRQHVERKLPVLTFRLFPPDERVLITDPCGMEHCCGELRNSTKTHMEQLRRRKSVAAKLAGIDPMIVVDASTIPTCGNSTSWHHDQDTTGTGTEEDWMEEEEEIEDDDLDEEEEDDELEVGDNKQGASDVFIEQGPNPAAAAHSRNLAKRTSAQLLRRQEEEGYLNGDSAVNDSNDAEESDIFEEEEAPESGPEGGYPFTTGLSSKGRKGTLIVITEDGKTWRRRNMRKKGSAQIAEYFSCISCEADKRFVPSRKFPTLTFLYTPSTDTRILQTNPSTRRHICGTNRSAARTTAEQLVRKRKAVARLAGIRPLHAYESAASEARNIGEAENWDESFLSNVLEEIVTSTPKRPRERLTVNGTMEVGASAVSNGVSMQNQGPPPPNLCDFSANGQTPSIDHPPDMNPPIVDYPPEFPPDLAAEIRNLVVNSHPTNSSGGWQLYTGDGIIVFVRR